MAGAWSAADHSRDGQCKDTKQPHRTSFTARGVPLKITLFRQT
jgi:hypothetical protein